MEITGAISAPLVDSNRRRSMEAVAGHDAFEPVEVGTGVSSGLTWPDHDVAEAVFGQDRFHLG